MTTSSDSLASWLQWLEQQQNLKGGGPASRSDRPWQFLLHDSLETLTTLLAQSPDWQATLNACINDAAMDAAALSDRIMKFLPPDIAWLKQFYFQGCKAPEHPEPSLAAGLFCQFSAWPALGLTAADQNHWHAFQQALPRAEEAARGYAARLRQMMMDALCRWQATTLAATREPASADLLQEKWLLALAQAWQAMLEDPQHALCLQEYNHAMEHLRGCGAPIAEGLFHTIGLPTREDLQGTQRRLQQLRRKQSSMDPTSEVAALRSEVATLREELDALRSHLQTATRDGNPH